MEIEIEKHPLEPFLPPKAKLLMLGSFPPQRKRWSMDFYYPNLNNDMWRIVGLLFFGDKEHFLNESRKAFCREQIVDFLNEKGIALFDTASSIRRLQDNASDKFLEVVQPTDIAALLRQLPECRAIVTTGQKATDTLREQLENGNPNGDPDAGNMPRVDPETGLGLVTDVCLKRKIRNYVETVKEDAAGYRIYVKDGVPLNRSDAEAYKALDVDEKTAKEKKKADPELDRKIRDWMCANFYDIRAFGAVMTTFMKAALNCGQIRGPVQLGFARSVEPVIPQEITITRVAITTEADAEKKGTEMGRKYIVPYGLYRCEGYISANLARKTTGFSEEDLSLLWEAILNMFENDHSAARGKMAVRELIVFRHDSELGCAPAWKLFDTVKIARKDPADASPARSFGDYTVSVDESALPAGITCTRMG